MLECDFKSEGEHTDIFSSLPHPSENITNSHDMFTTWGTHASINIKWFFFAFE